MAGDFPGGPEGRICLPVQGTQVQSLVGELRSHLQLSPSATMKEPVRHDAPHATTKTQHSQKKKQNKTKSGKVASDKYKIKCVLFYIFIGLEPPSGPD